jgi:NTP pyrophosphatase (non-canonical NTP hydrolase)
MLIQCLDDLKVATVDKFFEQPGSESAQQEDVIANACKIMAKASTQLIEEFDQDRQDKDSVIPLLKQVLRQVVLLSHIMEVELPEDEDIDDISESWTDELSHCRILASLMIQGRSSEIAMEYYLNEDVDTAYIEDLIWDLVSLVNILAVRIGAEFTDVLTLAD